MGKKIQVLICVCVLALLSPGSVIPIRDAWSGPSIEKRVDSRQERRGDRRENVQDGSQDRQEFRGDRRKSVGEGPESRVENRQDKREDRMDRTGDRMEDRGDRLNKRFE